MSSSPLPARRTNVLNGRSRSPSPAANSNMVHNSLPTAHITRDGFLNPDPTNNLNRGRRSTTELPVENIPLIATDNGLDPPIANPETDDSGDDRQTIDYPQPGVDDGFFFDRANTDGQTVPGSEPEDGIDDKRVFPKGQDPRFPDFELGGIPPDLESIPDINVYQHKKTLAQGMMDLALFSANANQLRYVLESDRHPYYYPGIVLIAISLMFQVAIGVGLIWNARYNVKDRKEICIANKINNFTVIGIFLVTVINVFISAFGVASVQPVVASAANP